MRVALDEANNFIFDPTFDQIANSPLDLTIAGTIDAITMVESQGKEVDNELMVRAFEFGNKIIVELCEAQNNFLTKYRAVHTIPEVELAIAEDNIEVATFVQNHLEKSDIDGLYGLGKIEFHDALGELVEKIAIKIVEDNFDFEGEEIVIKEKTFLKLGNFVLGEYKQVESFLSFDEAKNILEENNIKISEIADEIKNLVKDDMRAKILA